MPLPIVIAVLGAALLHAAWNALAHAAQDKLVAFALIDLGYLACSAVIVTLAPVPDRAAWPFIAGSAALQILYQLLLLQSYRLGDFGQVYPLARGTSPWVVAVLSVCALGESLPTAELTGVLVLSAGLAILAFADGRPGRAQLPALSAAVATGVMIASYTVVDATGVRRAGTVVGYVGWMFLAQALPLPLFALIRRRRSLLTDLRPTWPRGMTGGVLSLAAYGLVVWAQSRAPENLPAIAALRETSIILGVLMSTFLFHERLGRARTAASTVVLVGIAVLELTPR
ncbi:EamA family transporter [Streptomyces sp. NBC_01497]|uniref:EamA family transporter n=1 Tax=Streptomyces sp. NBC_01497 TaxID=2903885 RepID=UPI002E338CB4|nr:EamA family transporter [Streptomyces sp. NBC_01497]